MTVQSTVGVRRVEALDPALVTETLQELAADAPIAAVHIGMLGAGKVVRAVTDFLTQSTGKAGFPKLPNVVLDPILKSSSGAELLDTAGIKLLIEKLIPLADMLTPNVDEAALLTGLKVTDLDEMRSAANKLHEMGSRALVITGGHLDKAIDLLSFTTKRGIEQEVFKAERQRSNSTHGTGAPLDCNGLSPGFRSRPARGCPPGQDLRHRGDRRRPSTGSGEGSGPPPLPHAPAASRSGFRKRSLSF